MRKAVSAALFAAWFVLLLDMTLRWYPEKHPPVNLVPFDSIRHDLRVGGRDLVVNFLGNIAYFVPAGCLLTLVRSRPTTGLHALLFGLALSGSIEAAQYASGRRIADVDDVILNAAGVLIGHALTARWRGRGGPPPPAGGV